MEHLIRTTLDLEQFECEKCGRFVYLNKMEIEAVRQANPDKVIIPDCPFNCWSETKHRRTLGVEIREVIDNTPKFCAECKEMFIPTAENKVLCKECMDKNELYIIKELKKPDDIIEVHKTLENLFGE
jgi:hypothetical protein